MSKQTVLTIVVPGICALINVPGLLAGLTIGAVAFGFCTGVAFCGSIRALSGR